MSAPRATADTAFRVAERLRGLPAPWDVYGERTRWHEIHLSHGAVELTRGPILLEGYGVRLLQMRDGKTAVGFQASTDASERGIRATVEDAELVSRFSGVPAKDVQLPSHVDPGTPSPEVVDPRLWTDASGALESYAAALAAAFEGKPGVAISFGSVKVRLTEVSIANSAGLETSYAHTTVNYEVAVKSYGGPEGAPPGEYWVTGEGRRLEPSLLGTQAEEWSRFARDARRAKPPPNGATAVVLPPAVLAGILPSALDLQLSGRGELRGLSPALLSTVGAPSLQLTDDGTVPWAIGSSPVDDEGTPQRKRTLIADGKVSELLYDAVYGNALGHPSTGSGVRSDRYGLSSGRRFTRSPTPSASTLVVRPGDGGTDAELVEAAGDGIWVQHIGWSSPESVTTAFGGEIRIGYRIRHGKLAEPVRGGTIGGLTLAPPGAPSMLASLAAIGSRPELVGGVCLPSLLVRPLTVAGDQRDGATAMP